MKVAIDTADAFVREMASDELVPHGFEIITDVDTDVALVAVILDDGGDDDAALVARIARWNVRHPDAPVLLLSNGDRIADPPDGVLDVASKPVRPGVFLGRMRLAMTQQEAPRPQGPDQSLR